MALNLSVTSWANQINKLYESGIANAFVVYGNIGDYANTTIKIDAYLGAFLDKCMKLDSVAFFDVVNGAGYYKTANADIDQNNENLSTICKKVSSDDYNRGYIIKYPSLLVPCENRGMGDAEKANFITLHQTLSSPKFMNSKNIIIFLCDSLKDINPMFVSSNTKTATISVTLPDENNRLSFVDNLKKNNDEFKNIPSEMDDSMFAKLTAGLTLINIEDILLQAANEGNLKKSLVLEKKEELINKEYGAIIEIYDTNGYSLEKFAGQDHIKNYFKEVVIGAIRENNLSIVPKGVLLMGPPGTGKTYFSRCLAGDAGINFVEFKMSKILDKWVGEAEKNLEKAFSVFRALAPVGVFIDEIDQALSRGDNDSNSVNKNLFGMFLSELSKPENRGKIVWIGATNYPNKIDEALKRSGRFDKKIPFFAPESSEREVVFKIHLNKTKMKLSDDIVYSQLADETDGYTQAEIENIVVKALELTQRRHLSEITNDILMTALKYMMTAQNERIKEMEDIALDECNDIEFLPEKYIPRLKEIKARKREA